MWRGWNVLSIAAVALVGIQNAEAAENPAESAEVEEVRVTGEATGSLTSASPEESAKQKQHVSGGFTIKSADEMKFGRASNFEDLLQGAPGVFAQSENGMEVTKISIRGSGITAEDEPLGVMFLLDGLSYTYGDGEAILEDFDVSSLSHAEIFRGAAAFKYGALTLGGAINLVPFTGYDAAPFQSRVVGGSFGYFRANASGGAVEEPVDEFGSFSFRLRDGFRDHSSDEYSQNYENNFGHTGPTTARGVGISINLPLRRCLCPFGIPCRFSTPQRVLSIFGGQQSDGPALRFCDRCNSRCSHRGGSANLSSRRRLLFLRWNFVELVNRNKLPLVTRWRPTVASSRTDPS